MTEPRTKHLPHDSMHDAMHDLIHDLIHDVAKYLTRVARNLPKDGPIPEVLGAMLVKDLYETHRQRPASARFDELAHAIEDPALRAGLRAHLTEIDALEQGVRSGDAPSMRRAAELALIFDRELRAFVEASAGG